VEGQNGIPRLEGMDRSGERQKNKKNAANGADIGVRWSGWKVAVSERVMVPNYSGGGVPKYSAEWWKRASISLAQQDTTNENLPPTARTAPHLDQHGLTKNEHSRFAQERRPRLPG
jgi:hypothetical protein